MKNFRFIYIINAHFLAEFPSIFTVYYNYTLVFSDLFRSILNLHRHFKYVKKLSNEKFLDIRELDENFLTYYKIPRYIEWYNRPFSSIIICWFHPLSLWHPLILQALGLETSSHFFWQKGNTEGTALFFNIHFSSENIRKDLYNDIFCHVNLPG